MADTVITNTPAPVNNDSSAGWVVAVIILLVVIGGGIYAYRHGAFNRGNPSTTNINVTVPNPLQGGSDTSTQ